MSASFPPPFRAAVDADATCTATSPSGGQSTLTGCCPAPVPPATAATELTATPHALSCANPQRPDSAGVPPRRVAVLSEPLVTLQPQGVPTERGEWQSGNEQRGAHLALPLPLVVTGSLLLDHRDVGLNCNVCICPGN
jgi:hypothetical protein